MSSILAAGPRRRAAVAAALAATLVALLAGCGGSGDTTNGEDEDAIRAKLKSAANRLAEVPALEASVSIEASEEDSSETSSVCFSLSVLRGEKGTADDKVALRTYMSRCSDDPSSEAVIIGRDVWASMVGGKWTAARVDPSLVDELTDEEDEYDELLTAATDLRAGEAPRSYEFSAPASAFSQAEGLADTDIEADFVLTLDQRNLLQSLVATIEAEGAKALIETDYEIGEIGPIEAPPADDVIGSVRQIGSEAELESLLEPTFSEGFE